jgi:transposase
MESTVLGIDVSKATLDVVLVRPGQPALAGQFMNTQAGFKTLARWLHKHGRRTVHACLEATGLYGDEVAWYLHEAGHTVSVINPARIKAYADSQLQRNKTDRLDAALIADFCRTQQPAPWSPPDPAERELRSLARHLQDLKEMVQQERNRLSAGMVSPMIQQTLAEHIAFLEQQITTLEHAIQDHINHHPDLKTQRDLLDTIPGIGPLTAALLIAEAGDLRRFDHAGQVVAFAGLNPRQVRSGTSVRGQTRLSKRGSARLRGMLYFPALSARVHNPLIAPWCDQLAARGKSTMQIIGAAMRKLLVLAYGVLKSGQPFDPHFHPAAP